MPVEKPDSAQSEAENVLRAALAERDKQIAELQKQL